MKVYDNFEKHENVKIWHLSKEKNQKSLKRPCFERFSLAIFHINFEFCQKTNEPTDIRRQNPIGLVWGSNDIWWRISFRIYQNIFTYLMYPARVTEDAKQRLPTMAVYLFLMYLRVNLFIGQADYHPCSEAGFELYRFYVASRSGLRQYHSLLETTNGVYREAAIKYLPLWFRLVI